MLKTRIQIIIFGSLAISILMHSQRLVFVLSDREGLAADFGVTVEAVMLRMLLYFSHSCLLLNFNILWKNKWKASFLKHKAFNVATNLALLILGVIITTTVMVNFLYGSFKYQHVLAITTTDLLIVHPILLLLARLINLSFQQQQLILEKEQTKQIALQHQLEALRSHINPHFLFNALSSLVVLIRTKSDRALPFVNQLSELLRTTLQRSDDDFITIQNELEYLERYVYLQKERFGQKFKVDVQVPANWRKELIPAFSLQLLAENAIKHNILSTNHPLSLEIYPNGEYLIIRNKVHKRRDSTEGTGLGLFNLSLRFKLLKKREIKIKQDNEYFIVKLPINKNESNNN